MSAPLPTEFAPAGATVTAGCVPHDGGAEFWVHNPGQMPREVQLQVFQRSFSTKGAGRGLGTHSVKLLGERYLGGAVSFDTGPAGTTFRVRLPARLPADRVGGAEAGARSLRPQKRPAGVARLA